MSYIWHLRFLSNQDAPWDGHFKWENTNRCQFFISSTTDLDLNLWLPCDFRPLHVILGDTHEAYLLGCIRHTQHWPGDESTTEGHNKMQTRNGMESLTSSCVSCSLLHSPSGFTAKFSHLLWRSSGMRHANLLSDTVPNFLYSLWGNPYGILFSVTLGFLESCREHTNTKMIGWDGKTPKATADLPG